MRLGNYAELQGKSLDYVNAVSSLIWGGHVDHWPDHVKDAVNSIDGLDYDKAIQFIRDKPEKVDAVWQENQVAQLNAGHGGVPLMIFQGEPPTTWFEARYSIQLSYGHVFEVALPGALPAGTGVES